MTSANIVDITPENAQAEIVEKSFKQPVLVDFWADWCAPCKNLAPVLEKLAAEYTDQLTLAKINADEQQMLAAQFGVQSLPTVLIVKDGRPVDGFAGAQPETQVRELLDKYLPKPWDAMFTQAQELIATQQFAEALPILSAAYEQSQQRPDIALAYTSTLIACKRLDDAEAVLGAVKMADQDAAYTQLKAQLELAREAGKSPEIEALEAQHVQDKDNPELALQLALQYVQHDHIQEALTLLYPFLQKDLNCLSGEVKKAYTDVINSLPSGDALATQYQRKLYTLLY